MVNTKNTRKRIQTQEQDMTKEKDTDTKKNFIIFYALFAILAVVLIYMTFFADAQKIVAAIGLTNTYVIMFVITLVTGMSTLSSGLIYTSLFTFIKGGAHPVVIGAIAGIGAAAGDIFFYYIFSKGHDSMPKKAQAKVKRVMHWFDHRDARIVPFFIVMWVFLPLPNDILTFSISILGYPLKKVLPFLVLGDLGHMLLASILFSITFV